MSVRIFAFMFIYNMFYFLLFYQKNKLETNMGENIQSNCGWCTDRVQEFKVPKFSRDGLTPTRMGNNP